MITLYQGDCLEYLQTVEAGSVDAIITDLPYGTTQCSWDNVIPFAPMWEAVKRVLKPRGAFVTTASQPFTSALIMSNLDWFRYEWIWDKRKATGFLDCKIKPMKAHENICVFYEKQSTYNPQMIKGNLHPRGWARKNATKVYGKFYDIEENESEHYFPKTLLTIPAVTIPDHPTQKPVALYDYLIRTYTNAGDTVMDFTMGSGTTGVAAVQLGRNFIGCELDAGYFKIAERRIYEATLQPQLFTLDTKPVEKQSAFDVH